MSTAVQILEFDPFDNPMHLSKVGNWVITFLSPQEQTEHIQLAITNVIPRQVSDQLQPRRIVIRQADLPDQWRIEEIECYDCEQQTDTALDNQPEVLVQVIDALIQEFQKYDVHVNLISSEHLDAD